MKVEGLAYRYPGRDGFRFGPVDLAGPDDRPWLVLGTSGSGKSTLLRLLSGSLDPDRGRVEGPGTGELKERSGYLPQLPERALAGRNLAEDLSGTVRPPRARRAELRRALEAVNLAGIPLSRRSRELSTGERRRLALALLVLSGRSHWALDEPDAGLDAGGKATLRAILARRGAAEGSRLWIAGHRFEVYAPLRPWTVVLHQGKKILSGELAEVLSRAEIGEILGLERGATRRLLKALEGELKRRSRSGNQGTSGGEAASQVQALLSDSTMLP